MSTELAVPQMSVGELQATAKAVAASQLFPGIKTEQQAFTLMLLCQSEGLHPMQAVRRFHIMQGRPAMRADAMQAEFQRQGGMLRDIHADDRGASARFVHPVHAPEPGVAISFGEADAKKAGVYDTNPNYRKYPSSMYWARVISMGVRRVLPGVVVGIYTPEEVQDFDEPRTVQARVIDPPREHHAVNHNNDSGHGSGAYADPETVAAYLAFVKKFAEGFNDQWLDRHVGEDGTPTVKDLVNAFRLNGHLHKFGRNNGKFNAPEEVRSEQKNKFTALWFQRDPRGIEAEAQAYCDGLWAEAEAAMEPKPEDESQETPDADDADEWTDVSALEAATA